MSCGLCQAHSLHTTACIACIAAACIACIACIAAACIAACIACIACIAACIETSVGHTRRCYAGYAARALFSTFSNFPKLIALFSYSPVVTLIYYLTAMHACSTTSRSSRARFGLATVGRKPRRCIEAHAQLGGVCASNHMARQVVGRRRPLGVQLNSELLRVELLIGARTSGGSLEPESWMPEPTVDLRMRLRTLSGMQ